MKQIHILLLFGGESSEHEVSIESARNVYEAVDKDKFNVSLGYISRNGIWTLVDAVSDYKDSETGARIIPILGDKKFMIQSTSNALSPDLILPILHGHNGEDGTVQGLADLMHIPIVGCGQAASALCFDKVSTKRIAEACRIPVAEYVTHLDGSQLPSYESLVDKLGPTMFIKPAKEGSSIGVSKVTNASEFNDAINEAHKYDELILIEKAVVGRELEIAVLGNLPNISVSDVGEVIPDGEFYSYEAKYDSTSSSEVIIPADISDEIKVRAQNYARTLFPELGCRGMARIDFFLEGDVLMLNEINTIPGFTNISMYPKLWLASGMTYPELVEKLITLAIEPVTIES